MVVSVMMVVVPAMMMVMMAKVIDVRMVVMVVAMMSPVMAMHNSRSDDAERKARNRMTVPVTMAAADVDHIVRCRFLDGRLANRKWRGADWRRRAKREGAAQRDRHGNTHRDRLARSVAHVGCRHVLPLFNVCP